MDDSFLNGTNSYVELSFRVLDYSHSKLKVDAVQNMPASKFKTTTSKISRKFGLNGKKVFKAYSCFVCVSLCLILFLVLTSLNRVLSLCTRAFCTPIVSLYRFTHPTDVFAQPANWLQRPT